MDTNKSKNKNKGAPVYSRKQHAAHYGNSGGHDLESWTFAAETRPGAPPEGVPAGAEYRCGFCVAGVQHWVWARRAPLTGTCRFCERSA